MKKIIYLMLPLIFLLVSCSKPIKNYELYFQPSAYSYEQPLIISNTTELLSISDETLINKYDDNFFSKKQLIVLSHSFGSAGGNESFEVTKLYVKNSKIYLNLTAKCTGFAMVVVNYIVYIEIDKVNVNQIVLTKVVSRFE
jgi:hypothetical protein